MKQLEKSESRRGRGRPSNEEKLRRAKSLMLETLKASPVKVYSQADLRQLIDENREKWNLSSSFSYTEILNEMEKSLNVAEIVLRFPRPARRLLYGDPSIYEVALSVKANGFFSHYTALRHHDLTEQIPKTIYVNEEQVPKSDFLPELTQEGIQAAFQKRARVSNCVADYGAWRICQLSTMGSQRLGIIEAVGPEGERFPVTDIERTLIDVAVRPVYAGGVQEVLKAFVRAAKVVSVNRLAALLKQSQFRYPYHQSIGYYLEKSGVYSGSAIDIFRRFEQKFDFYLDHTMKQPHYIKEWRLFVPMGF